MSVSTQLGVHAKRSRLVGALAMCTAFTCTVGWVGCSGGTNSEQIEPADTAAAQPAVTVPSVTESPTESAPQAASSTAEGTLPAIPTISLNGSSTVSQPASTTAGSSKTATPADEKRRRLLEAMKPVQIMLGSWKGTTQKAVGDFKALTKPEWVWDFQTNRDEPAMVMKSDESPYFKEARLTYLTEDDQFKLTTIGPEGEVREFAGKFSAPVEEFQGDDQKMHVKFKLQLQQLNGDSPRNTWQVTFNQQDNHRYLVELARKSGSNFIRFDTIATQREGTSFGKSDVGYGERECIISGGLGTSQVSFGGKSYWVCCSGCRAAFDEDPQSWIAEYEAKKAAQDSGS